MQFQDRLAEEAFIEVAALLAAAYQRHVAARCIVPALPADSPPELLDNSGGSSLHEQ